MAHNIEWLEENRVLLIEFRGYQDNQTISAAFDDAVTIFKLCRRPFVVMVNWCSVTSCELKALLSMRGHLFYTHPNTVREVMVGMDVQSRFENEIASVKTRSFKNTEYFDTMGDAIDYVNRLLAVV